MVGALRWTRLPSGVADPQMKLGINLNTLSYFTTEQPFLDVFKYGAGWDTTDDSEQVTSEETSLPLDDNGWPTNVNFGSTRRVRAGFLVDTQVAPYYPGGRYIVLYEGSGTLSYTRDAVKNVGLSVAGRDVIDVATPSSSGIYVYITSTSPSPDHIKNIRVVHEDYESYLLAGEIFHPTFLAKSDPFKIKRFMDWMRTNEGRPTTWDTRPTMTQAFWASEYGKVYSGSRRIPIGAPLEVMVALCNKQSADMWWCAPGLSDDEYETESAVYVKDNLDTSLRVFRESWNEQWNFGIPVTTAIIPLGYVHFPSAGSDFSAAFNYHLLRTVQGGKIWKDIFTAAGQGSRCIRVLGAQGAYTDRTRFQLDATCDLLEALETYWTGTVGQHIDAVAIAPYFIDSGFPENWTEDVDGGLTKAFTEIMTGGLVPTDADAVTTGGTATAFTVATGRSLPSTPTDQTMVALRMNAASGANPTLRADGGTAYPLQKRIGTAVDDGQLYSDGIFAFCFNSSQNAWVLCPTTGYAGGDLARALARITPTLDLIAARSLPVNVVCYEGGPHLVDFGDDQPALQTLYALVNSDPRMYDVITTYIGNAALAGVVDFCYFNDVGRDSKFGYWGSLHHIMQTTSQEDTPKYQALADYVN